MRVLLFSAALAACILVAKSDPGLAPPQPAQKRLGFGGDTLQKLVSWFFPGQERTHHQRAYPTVHHSSFVRAPGPKYGPPQSHGPPSHGPPSHGPPSHGPPSHGPPSHGPPRSRFNPPPSGLGPILKACNPCNKVPWIPIPHAQFQDGGNAFAVVNAPQLHQGIQANAQQPNVPVYHHSPLPQGYLPGSQYNNRPEGSVAVEEHVAAPSGIGSQPEVIPSIAVGDFISSIEYPIDVIQSPLIDLDSSKSAPLPVQQYGAGRDHDNTQDTKLDLPAVGEAQHASELPPPVVVHHDGFNNNVDLSINNNNQNNAASIPSFINSEIGVGGGSSYQNVNIEQTRQQTFSITPSVQTASGHVQEVQGSLPTPIPTQQQPPLNIPASPFHIPSFQQPPSFTAPSAPGVFLTGPSASSFTSSGQRLPPIGFTGPQQPNTFLHVPKFPQQPNQQQQQQQQQPTRLFSSPGTLRQLPPSAEGLSPPPPPQSQYPYRFEYIPPSGNGLLQVNPQPVVVSTTQAPWTPSGPPPGTGPALIDAVPQQPQSQQNFLLDAQASGLRSQWHHREINHQFQESKIVNYTAFATGTTPSPLKATTHILASDLRALLRKEQSKQQQQALNNNMLKLQKNIDSWTAQEFSNPDFVNIVDDRQKQLTTASAATLSPSKIIPNDYFATSPSYRDTTARPNYFDHEAAGSIAHNIHAKVFSKGSVFKVTRPKAVEETTTEEATTTEFTTLYPSTTVEPRKTTNWDFASVGFSQSSNEKVYVVTPMSTHQWTAGTTTTPKIPTYSAEKPFKGYFVKSKAAASKYQTTTSSPTMTSIDASAFRSPRFTVRPTPGAPSVAKIVDVRTSTPPSRGNRFYSVPSADPYDTTTLSPVTVAERRSSSASIDLTSVPTFTPPQGQNIETAHGHSKVVTVVTSESSSSSVSQKKATRLSVKPVLKVEKDKVVAATKEVKEDEEEVVAAVREVSAVDLKRKTTA